MSGNGVADGGLVQTPAWGEKLLRCTVTGEPFDDGFRRKQRQLCCGDLDVFPLRENGNLAGTPLRCQRCATEDVQQVNLDGIRPEPSHDTSGFQHVRIHFAGQPVDEVDTNADVPLPQRLKAAQELVEAIATAELFCRGIMDGLESQLHGEGSLFGNVRQHVQHRRRQTVRTSP